MACGWSETVPNDIFLKVSPWREGGDIGPEINFWQGLGEVLVWSRVIGAERVCEQLVDIQVRLGKLDLEGCDGARETDSPSSLVLLRRVSSPTPWRPRDRRPRRSTTMRLWLRRVAAFVKGLEDSGHSLLVGFNDRFLFVVFLWFSLVMTGYLLCEKCVTFAGSARPS